MNEAERQTKTGASKHQKLELDLASMYLHSSVAGAHSIGLQLTAEQQGEREGALSLDPNHCGLNDWGDRAWCSEKPVRAIPVTVTRTWTEDNAGRKRVLHSLSSDAFEHESASLIEYPEASLWYLVYTREESGAWVVPLFDAGLLEPDPSLVIASKSAKDE